MLSDPINQNNDHMATYANNYTTTAYEAPGSILVKPTATTVTETVITQNAPAQVKKDHGAFGKILNMFAALTGVAMFLGAVLLVVGAALSLTNQSFYYRTIGILFVVGFGIWCISALFQFISSMGLFSKRTRNLYMGANLISSLCFALGSACLVLFAAFWLANTENLNYAGQILAIIGAGLFLIGFSIRNYGAVADGISSYKQTYLPTNVQPYNTTANAPYTNTYQKPSKSYLLGIHSNAWASTLYVIASTMLVVGAVMYEAFGRNAFNGFGVIYLRLASIFWIISGGIFILGSIAHCISRR